LPVHSLRLHQDSKAFLTREPGSNPVPTVVVTHHAPHPRSIPARFRGDPTTPAFASNLSGLIEEIKQRAVPNAFLAIKEEADGPGLLLGERTLSGDLLSGIPSCSRIASLKFEWPI